MLIDSEKLKRSIEGLKVDEGDNELCKAYNRGLKASIELIKMYERIGLEG